jgi:hypothetical protein
MVANAKVLDANNEIMTTPTTNFSFLMQGSMSATITAQEKAVTCRSRHCEVGY